MSDSTPLQSELLKADDVVAPPALTPGWRTTEFWLTLATTVISLLVGLGVVGPDFARRHEDVVNAVCLLAATMAPAVYALARGIAKHGHQQALGGVLTTAIAHGQLKVAASPRQLKAFRPYPADAGATLIGLIGAIVAVIGGVWLIVGAVHDHFDVVGLILLLVGIVILWFDGAPRSGGRLWP